LVSEPKAWQGIEGKERFFSSFFKLFLKNVCMFKNVSYLCYVRKEVINHTKIKKMRNSIKTTDGFSAHVEFSDLEKLGWDFSSLYQGVADCQGTSLFQAEAWEKENYHVRLFNNGNGVYWIPSHNEEGDTGDAQWPGDESQTEKDIQQLYAVGAMWEVFEGEY
jgi:hypothetical protein